MTKCPRTQAFFGDLASDATCVMCGKAVSEHAKRKPAFPTHSFAQCPELNRTLGYPRRDADGVPMLPPGALVEHSVATCTTCRAFATAPQAYSGAPLVDLRHPFRVERYPLGTRDGRVDFDCVGKKGDLVEIHADSPMLRGEILRATDTGPCETGKNTILESFAVDGVPDPQLAGRSTAVLANPLWSGVKLRTGSHFVAHVRFLEDGSWAATLHGKRLPTDRERWRAERAQLVTQIDEIDTKLGLDDAEREARANEFGDWCESTREHDGNRYDCSRRPNHDPNTDHVGIDAFSLGRPPNADGLDARPAFRRWADHEVGSRPCCGLHEEDAT